MQLRTLLATVTAGGALAAGAGFAFLPAAEAHLPGDPAAAGSVVAWGADSVAGSTDVSGVTAPVIDASANSSDSAVVTADGHFQVWGDPASAQVTEAPTGVTDAAAIVLDPSIASVLLMHRDGTLSGWGGAGTPDLESGAPAKVKAIALAAGSAFGVTPDGKLATWGAAKVPGSVNDVPVRVTSLTDIVDVAVGTLGGVVLRANGTAVGWGQSLSDYGMGDPFNAPLDDLGGHKVVQVAAGGYAAGLVLDDGTIRLWGMTGVAPAQRSFPDQKVISLTLSSVAGVVLEDANGNRSVDVWGTPANPYLADVTDPADLAALANRPVASLATSENHILAIVTSFREVTKPTISGTPAVGSTLHATPATFSLAPSTPATGQWYVGSEPVDGQGNDLRLTSGMIGKAVAFRNTATRDGETLNSDSALTAPVGKALSTTKVAVTPAAATVGTARTVTATVTSLADAVTGTVTFHAGSLTTAKPVVAGKATWALPATVPVGAVAVTASYSGDKVVSPSSARTTLTVSRIRSTLALKASATGKTKKSAKRVKLTVTVKGAGTVSAAGKVTLIVKGKGVKKTIKIFVTSRGLATASLKKIKRGKYTVSVQYAGNSTVAGSARTFRIKI